MSRLDAGPDGSSSAIEFPPEWRRRLAEREPEALARFFDATFDRVYAYLRRMVADEHLAEDLTQDVFLQVQRSLATYDPERDPRPWVLMIATNKLRDHWRSRAHHEGRQETSLDQDELSERLPAASRGPDADLTRDEFASELNAAIERLPAGLRAALLLRVYEGLSFEEIGILLERNEVAARKRYSRALEALRESLGDSWRAHAEGSR